MWDDYKGIFAVGVLFILAFLGFALVFPTYNVWQSEMAGKAELAAAEYSKQIAVQTAKAKKDSAQYEADAEIIRAGGVAQANAIIGESLKNNEAYLRYLYINQLENNNNSVIYVPTEAGLPILEAGKRK